MNKNVNYIKNRLSLRSPQADSLEILSDLCEKLELNNHCDLESEFTKIKDSYPTVSDFERDFPCLCFALATGVGKTRLMGAFIAYLYKQKGIRNFFVLAPNLTVYNKLIEDFSNPQNPKYIFPGIGEFAQWPPRIITGDSYKETTTRTMADSIDINIFNISKINAETRGGKVPRIKRLSEYIGESYFDYLSNLDDLVIIMDESHHYRAERGMQVINELKPVLGLELTATPHVERNGGTQPFKNIVYQYSLGRAIEDGFVKIPAIATRKDFDPSKYSVDELDRIKLEDGINIHEDTKVALDVYARDGKCRSVKPFVLVVTKDTDHASTIKEFIQSKAFFDGRYADKVMEIHSNQRGGEKEDNIQRLLALEHSSNKIEIVIHVNMLKEGWDVTNLYTIIPLRTATSTTLREQTIGRGLRLPYGKRTGNTKVDKLTIVAHDKFQEIVDAANRPDSIINRQNIIEIDPEELRDAKEVIVAKPVCDEWLDKKHATLESIESEEEKEKAGVLIEVKKAVIEAIPEVGRDVASVTDLTNEDIRKIVMGKAREKMTYAQQPSLFIDQAIKDFEKNDYETTVKEFSQAIIEIPRIIIQPSDDVDAGYSDFDLDVINLNYPPVSEEIRIKLLQRTESEIETLIGKSGTVNDSPANLILNELIDFPQVDYGSQSDLLLKLTGQALEKLKGYLNTNDLANVVKYHKRDIARFIYVQMKDHFYYNVKSYNEPKVLPFVKIEGHNLTKFQKDAIHHYTDTITPTSTIPQKVFAGFIKACHNLYKFDGKSEKDFAAILENDSEVDKWLRPAPNQFRIYWDHNSRQYEPDFVVETSDCIYLVEIKMESAIGSHEVQEKAKAALQYCKYATDFTTKNGGKSWKYILIPHNEVLPNMSFKYLAAKHEYSGKE